MKPENLVPLPPALRECQRVFGPRTNYHPVTPDFSAEELWELMPGTRIYQDGEADFKGMLPRFFELAWGEVEKGGWPDLLPVGPLVDLCWEGWPERERKAIEGCFASLGQAAIGRGNEWVFSDILTTMREIGVSWCCLLEDWLASSLSSSALWYGVHVRDWEELDGEVRGWLCQPRVLARVEADFFVARDSKDAADISRLYELLSLHCE